MDKIQVVKLTSLAQAIDEAMSIWAALSYSPNDTRIQDVLEEGYKSNNPLCDYLQYDCFKCPHFHCYDANTPFFRWAVNKTPANADAVYQQLYEAKELYKNKLNNLEV